MKNYIIEPVSPEGVFDKAELFDFFTKYLLEDYYLRKTNLLGSACKEDFFIRKIERKCRGCMCRVWTQRNEQGDLISLWGMSKRFELSRVYRKNMYMLDFFYTVAKEDKEDVIYAVCECMNAYTEETRIDYLRCKINMLDHDTIYYLSRNGFLYYASSEKFFFKYENYRKKDVGELPYTVVAYQNEDLDACLDLLGLHSLNEKYYNLTFHKELTLELFREWFERQTHAKNTKIFVCKKKDDAQVVGVTMFSEIDIEGKKVLTWDLVVVSNTDRGQNLSLLLFEYMLGMCQYDIEASVMTDNIIIHNKLRMIGFEEVMSFVFMEKRYDGYLLPQMGVSFSRSE